MSKTIFELGETLSRSEYYRRMDTFLNRCYANLKTYEVHCDIQPSEARELKHLEEALQDAKAVTSFWSKTYEAYENTKESD